MQAKVQRGNYVDDKISMCYLHGREKFCLRHLVDGALQLCIIAEVAEAFRRSQTAAAPSYCSTE